MKWLDRPGFNAVAVEKGVDISPAQITAGILAGGAARRLGGVDKGWYVLAGQSLIERTLERIRPQATRVMISANRSLSRYRRLGCDVFVDDSNEMLGPLAGVATILRNAKTPYVLLTPVDTPLLPLDLACRLSGAMTIETDFVIARTAGRVHPLHALLRRSLWSHVDTALSSGVRRVTDWQESLRGCAVDWPADHCFANVNTPQDAESLALQL